MAQGSRRRHSLPPLTIDVSDPIPVGSWAPLPTHDRIQVGGHTVWLDTAEGRGTLIVPQPNRWGIVESAFPDLPCLVEADPEVTAHLPLPPLVEGYVDRTHRAIRPPQRTTSGRSLLEAGSRLAKMLTQIPGVKLVDTPISRTIPLLTPVEAEELIDGCRSRGVVGIRSLPGLGGGVALTVHVRHPGSHLEQVATTVAEVVRRRG